jgi:hypothetical protein
MEALIKGTSAYNMTSVDIGAAQQQGCNTLPAVPSVDQ